VGDTRGGVAVGPSGRGVRRRGWWWRRREVCRDRWRLVLGVRVVVALLLCTSGANNE